MTYHARNAAKAAAYGMTAETTTAETENEERTRVLGLFTGDVVKSAKYGRLGIVASDGLRNDENPEPNYRVVFMDADTETFSRDWLPTSDLTLIFPVYELDVPDVPSK